jgi:hypothetical protein
MGGAKVVWSLVPAGDGDGVHVAHGLTGPKVVPGAGVGVGDGDGDGGWEVPGGVVWGAGDGDGDGDGGCEVPGGVVWGAGDDDDELAARAGQRTRTHCFGS